MAKVTAVGLCLVAALLPAALVAAAYTPAQRAAFEATIDNIDGTLNLVDRAMRSALNASGTPCTRSIAACGVDASPLLGYTIDFNRAVQTDYAFVQSFVQTEPPSTAENDVICQMQQMRGTWDSQLTEATGRRGDVLFQYYADTATQSLGLYPPRRWDCSVPYVPSSRPWYIAGATGQKDIVILIDIADDTARGASPEVRVAAAVRGAKALLRTLSFRDYVAVLPYTTFADESLTPALVQATAENVAKLSEQLDQLSVVAGAAPKLGIAVDAGVRILQTAEASSQCNKIMIALASSDVGAGTDAAVALKSAGNVMGFAVQVLDRARTAADSEAILGLRRLACGSSGRSVVTDPANVEADVLVVYSHTAQLQENNRVRWSEVYTDAFGQGQILTGARAIYFANGTLRGLVGMDVSLSTVNDVGQLSEGEVNELLLANQQCDRVSLDDTSGKIAAAQGTQCAGIVVNVPESDELSDRKLKALWVIIAIVIPVILGLLVPLTAKVRRTRFSPRELILLGIAAVTWVAFLIIFFTSVFDDAVDRTNFDSVDFRTVRQEPNPFRCCEKRNCVCREYTEDSTRCRGLIAELTEGTCGGGYLCCNWESYSCNCRTDSDGHQQCSTCHRCTRSVRNVACEVACGVCSTPTATVDYVYEGIAYQVDKARSCGLNATGCVSSYFDDYPVGELRTGYVDPSNPTDLRLEVTYSGVAVAFCAITGGISLIAWVIALVLTLTAPKRDTWY